MNCFAKNNIYRLLRSTVFLLLAMFCAVVFSLGLDFFANSAFASVRLQQNQQQNVLVQFHENVSAEARALLIAEMGGELVVWMPQINVAEIRMQAIGSGIGLSPTNMTAMASGVASGLITFAETNAEVSATYIPRDPDFSTMMMSHGLEQIHAIEAWDIVTGSSEIVIAVIDSGVRLDHPEFQGRLVAGYDFVNEDTDADDDSGHGTHVAGIIAAALDNDQGIAGVCPECRLMPVKVLNANNMGSWAQLAQGILFAVDNGARIVNLSLGSIIPSETLASAVDYAVESGVVVVAAAGNYDSDNPFYPAALEGVIGVSATTIKEVQWAKSNFGSYIDLAAPGEIIYSTYHDLDNIYRGYTYMSGTSMSAAYVSGVAGLLLSVAPTLGADDVYSALTLGADDLGSVGWDPEFGHGLVNAMGALRAPVKDLLEAVGELAEPRRDLVVYLPSVNNH